MIANARRISAIIVFLALIACLPLISGAPFRILAIYAGSFTLAFLVPALIMANKEGEEIIPWVLSFGLIGVLFFDILSEYAIAKHELGSTIILFPISLVPLIAIHAISRIVARLFSKFKENNILKVKV